MSQLLRIEKAELKDAGIIAGFNLLLAKETENKDLDPDTAERGVKAVIKDPHKGFFLVARQKGNIVGQMMVTSEWSDWRNMNFLWIQSVYVPKEYRKQGVFKALYHHLKDLAAYRKDVAGIRLYVEQYNESAQLTYENLGMVNPGYKMYEVLL